MLSIDFNNEVIKAAPIAAGVGADVAARFMGLTLNEWFYVAAIAYTLCQTGLTVYKTIKEQRRADKNV